MPLQLLLETEFKVMKVARQCPLVLLIKVGWKKGNHCRGGGVNKISNWKWPVGSMQQREEVDCLG
jgi:hypothetical protein